MNGYRITVDVINGPYSPAINVNQFNFLNLESIRYLDCGIISEGIGIDKVIEVKKTIGNDRISYDIIGPRGLYLIELTEAVGKKAIFKILKD